MKKAANKALHSDKIKLRSFLATLYFSGEQGVRRLNAISLGGEVMFCSKCGSEVGSESRFCSSCGTPVVLDVSQEPEVEIRSPAPETSSAKDSADELTLDEMYRAFIGPEKSSYYLPLFSQFDLKNGGSTSWNWPAAFITQLWMLYKGMFLWGFLWYPILGGIASFLIALPFVAAGNEGAEALSYLAYFVVSVVVMGLYSNKIYHGHVKKKIEKSGKLGLSAQERKEWLIRKGSSNFVFVFVLILFLVSIIGILAAIAIPAYQDYTNRAKVSVGLANVGIVKEHYLDYVVETQRWPTGMQDLKLDRMSDQFGDSIASVEIGSDNELRIMFSGNQIEGKTVVLIPSVENQTLVWDCQVESLPAKYAPATCR